MKKIIFMLAVCLFAFTACSDHYDNRRKIHVNGYAETEITPDIIYFGIALKEYVSVTGQKLSIDSLEKQLYRAVLKAGIPKKDLMVNDMSSYNTASQKQKSPDFIVRKQYRIKMRDLNSMGTIISAFDPKAIEYTQVESYDHSKLETLKKEIKIKAIQDARTKAAYLAEAGGCKLGELIEVRESSGIDNTRQFTNAMNVMPVEQTAGQQMDLNFKKIKLSYVMSTVFELN